MKSFILSNEKSIQIYSAVTATYFKTYRTVRCFILHELVAYSSEIKDLMQIQRW